MHSIFIALALIAQDGGKLYDHALGSTVWITSINSEWESSHGSGVIIEHEKEKYVLTAYHVVKGDTMVYAYPPIHDKAVLLNTPDQYKGRVESALRCTVVHFNAKLDLALLRIKAGKPGRPMALAAKNPDPGDVASVVGNGEKVLWRFSPGHVKAVFRDKATFHDQDVDASMVEHTVPVNPGDSGSALFDHKGKLIGIISFIETDKVLVSKAIGVDEIRSFLSECPKTPRPGRKP